MARIYMGNQEAADRGLLESLRRLPDNYHVFVEFQIPSLRGQRQVDFLVIREDPGKPCIFCLEVKMERRRLRGTINGPWEFEEAPGLWRILPVSNPRDQNPIQQAYNTARAMQTWLASMRALIQSPEQPWPDVPTVFPRLVLPVAHPDNQLQTDSFTWRFDGYERCLDSLTSFIPRDPVPLSVEEIERLARHLGVRRIHDTPVPEPSDDPAWLRAALARLGEELTGLRQEVRDLRLALGNGNGAANGAPAPPRYGAPPPAYRPQPPPQPQRDLDTAYRVLVEVIRDLRNAGRKLVFPNVQEGLWRRLGGFDAEHYGFFKFKEFLQEAERRHLVQLHVIDGIDFVSLPGEEPQPAPEGSPSSLDDLAPDEQTQFLSAIAQLEARSAYMIRSYIARHLTGAGVLNLPMYEIRALVNDAVQRGLFTRGQRPFRHPATGELQSLETLSLDPNHPLVAGVLAQLGDLTAPAYPAGREWVESGGYNEGRWQGENGWREERPNEGERREEWAAAQPAAPTNGWQNDPPAAQWAAPAEQWVPDGPAAAEGDEAGGWDSYARQSGAWSLDSAEADLHGPAEAVATAGNSQEQGERDYASWSPAPAGEAAHDEQAH